MNRFVLCQAAAVPPGYQPGSPHIVNQFGSASGQLSGLHSINHMLSVTFQDFPQHSAFPALSHPYTLSSRPKQDHERSEWPCAVEGPAVRRAQAQPAAQRYTFGGAGGVNCAKSANPSSASIPLIFFSASSNPSFPNILCSMSSNWSEISSSCSSEKFFFHAGNTIVSSRAAWF